MILFNRDDRLTFVENYVWANLGWLFCELCFTWADYTPDALFWVFSWAHSVGTFFYERAFGRIWNDGDYGE